ncbi:MAG: preprotein translocase subunit YajC [Planctomycetota bacterium]|nr:preprotein translocase subunit YajC [Planctomycetota bacterium]MDA1105077.1 preprotein translocase subunit YajC [Planctomycetota bacterium]
MTDFIQSDFLLAMQTGTTSGSAPALPGEAAAQIVPADGGGAGTTGGTAAAPGFDLFWIFIPILVVMILFSFMGQRKERKRRQQLLSSIEKHDKVQTSGGIIGHVVEVKPDTVTLKVDEGSNIRITFAKNYVTEVLEKSSSSS